MLVHDVSARAGDVSMGIAVFPIGWIYSRPFEKLRDGQIASTFDQRSANERKGEIPQAREITCRHVSSKTHYNCQPLRNLLYNIQVLTIEMTGRKPLCIRVQITAVTSAFYFMPVLCVLYSKTLKR